MFEKVLENMYFNEPVSEGCFLFFLFFFCVVSNSLHFLTPLKIMMGRLTVCYCLLVQLTTPRGYFAEHFPGQWTKSTILLCVPFSLLSLACSYIDRDITI